MSIVLDGTNGITTPTYNGADTSEYVVPVTAMKNRIINGAMMIDQRNAGASVSVSTPVFGVDRFICEESSAGVLTVQRTTDAPTGFTNSLKFTVTTASASVGAAEYSAISQIIEGFNVADFMLGTVNAVTFTVSFWVKSSVTGWVNCTLQNGASTRLFPTAINITAANTWEYKTITVAGDTSGSWDKTNGRGLMFQIYPTLGSNYIGASGWNASNIYGTQTSSNFMATVGNTFAITGVQLEKGSTATSFDYRPYGTELALCQRYYIKWVSNADALGFTPIGSGVIANATTAYVFIPLPVAMRSSPTLAYSGTVTCYDGTVTPSVSSIPTTYVTSGLTVWAALTTTGGMTAGRSFVFYGQNASTNFFTATSEL